jgi:hypothetical protein
VLDALAPVVDGARAQHKPERLSIVVRPFPLPGEGPGARLFLFDGARVLTHGLAAHMPNGAELARAARDVVALALASLPDDVLTNAETLLGSGSGVAQLLIEPAEGTVRVALTAAGRSVVLGALVDEPGRAH